MFRRLWPAVVVRTAGIAGAESMIVACTPTIRTTWIASIATPLGGMVPPTLPNDDEVQAWVANNHADVEPLHSLYALLSPDEIARAQRFRFERDRNQYVIARGLLRRLLAGYIHIDPAAIAFQYSAKGKPRLANSMPCIDFNIAHSGTIIVLAFTRGKRIGIDVEQVRTNIEIDELAERFFSLSERNCLRALAWEQRHAAFFRCWTRKEAFLKATGEGLSKAFDSFDVFLDPGENSFLLESRTDGDWLIRDLEIAPGYAAAVALAHNLKITGTQVFPSE